MGSDSSNQRAISRTAKELASSPQVRPPTPSQTAIADASPKGVSAARMQYASWFTLFVVPIEERPQAIATATSHPPFKQLSPQNSRTMLKTGYENPPPSIQTEKVA